MPRNTNPSLITSGKGSVSPKAVEDVSLRNPHRDSIPLRSHVNDDHRSHMGSSIGLLDPSDYFASSDVEGALEELAAGFSESGQNGVLSGGTFTDAGLVVTMGTTIVRVGTLRGLSGLSETLTNNATNWLYVDSTGSLSHSTGAAPSPFSPEIVLLWRIVTAGGSVTGSTDARFFVPNLDRKLPYTLRSEGTALNQAAEACFVSMDALILWLTNFGDESKKTHVVVRGSLTVASTVTIPVDNVVFEGEDGATFVTGGAVSPMFNLSGRDGIGFRNIGFLANHGFATAISSSLGGTRCFVDRCSFSSGVSDWVRAVSFTATTVNDFRMSNCDVTASEYGVFVSSPVRCVFEDTNITDAGAPGTTGISLGDPGTLLSTEGQSHVLRCVVVGFTSAIYIKGLVGSVESCSISDAVTGVEVGDLASDISISKNYITTNSTTGEYGVTVIAATGGVKIDSNHIVDLRAAGSYTAETPAGVFVDTTDDVSISDCIISGFLVTGGTGWGVLHDGGDRISVRGGHISACGLGVVTLDAGTSGISVSEVSISNVVVGIDLLGTNSTIYGCSINLSSSTGETGINSGTTLSSSISDCSVTTARVYVHPDAPIGIGIYAGPATISNCVVSGFTVPSSVNGIGIYSFAGVATISGGSIVNCRTGVSAADDFCKISGVTMSDVMTGVSLSGAEGIIQNCRVDMEILEGLIALDLQAGSNNSIVSECDLYMASFGLGGVNIPSGISVASTNVQISDCYIFGFDNAASYGNGVGIQTGGSSVSVDGCEFISNHRGVEVIPSSGVTSISVTGCRFSANQFESVYSVGVTGMILQNNFFLGDFVSLSTFLDLDIVGNVFRQCGLRLIGAGATPSKRFSVTGNTILEDGITISFLVQDGVISGNQIDGYISADPYDPVETGIYIIPPGAGNGAQNITISGNTVQRCTRGIIVSGSYDYRTQNISITGNTVHHCAISQTGVAVDSLVGRGSIGIGVESTDNLTVTGNTVYKIGILIDDSGVEDFPSNDGPDVIGNGIYIRSSRRVNLTGNTVVNSMSTGSGFGIGIYVENKSTGQPAFNTFVIYDVNVSHNNIYWDTGLAGNGEGIDGLLISVERGTDPASSDLELRNVSVVGNNIHNVEFGNIYLLIGAGSSLTGLVVSSNNCTTATAGSGISVVSTVGTGATGVSITDNVLDTFNQHGINMSSTSTGNPTGTFDSCRIGGNTLRNWCTAAAGSCGGIRVVIEDALHWSVSDNVLVSTQDSALGMHFRVDGGDTRNFNISSNTVEVTGLVSQSMLWATGASATQDAMNIIGNSFYGAALGVNYTGSFSPDRSVCAMNSERTTAPAGNWGVGGAGTFTNPFTNSTVTPNQD